MKGHTVSMSSVCKHHALAAYAKLIEDNLDADLSGRPLDCAIELAEIGKRKRRGADRRKILAARILLLNRENEIAKPIPVVVAEEPKETPPPVEVAAPEPVAPKKAKPAKTTYGLDQAASLLASFSDPEEEEGHAPDLSAPDAGNGKKNEALGMAGDASGKAKDASMPDEDGAFDDDFEDDDETAKFGDGFSMGEEKPSGSNRRTKTPPPEEEISKAKRAAPKLLEPEEEEKEQVYRPKGPQMSNQPSLESAMEMMFSKSKKEARPAEEPAAPVFEPVSAQESAKEIEDAVLVENDVDPEVDDPAAQSDDVALADPEPVAEKPKPARRKRASTQRKPRASSTRKSKSAKKAADAAPVEEETEIVVEPASELSEATLAPAEEVSEGLALSPEPEPVLEEPPVVEAAEEASPASEEAAPKPKKKKKGGVVVTPIDNFDFSSLSSFSDDE